MKFDVDVPIWKACGKGLDGRAILEHVLVERIDDGTARGLLVAANGYILAVGACDLDDGDVPGLVHRSMFKRAAKEQRRSGTDEWATLGLGKSAITLPDGGMYPRVEVSPFPDWRKIVPKRLPVAERHFGAFTVTGSLLSRLLDALGCSMATFTLGAGQNSQILVERSQPNDDGAPQPPYGVLMPAIRTWDADGAK